MYPMYETMACAFRMDAYAALAIVLAFRLILSMIDFRMVVLFGWNLKPKKSSGRLLNKDLPVVLDGLLRGFYFGFDEFESFVQSSFA